MTPFPRETVNSRLGALYVASQGDPFYGLMPGTTFKHGYPRQVARFKPVAPVGYHSEVTETRMPASFYTATVTAPDGQVKEFLTGSGTEAGALLRKLCEAFRDGTASFDCDEDTRASTATATPRLAEDGRRVKVFKSGKGGFELLLDELQSFSGFLPAQAFVVQNRELALAAAKSIAQGMLDVQPPAVRQVRPEYSA